jgi:hypothetical protein
VVRPFVDLRFLRPVRPAFDVTQPFAADLWVRASLDQRQRFQ